MRQLTCEICGSNELIKQEGIFVCQSCGCKYSVEEVRRMMANGTDEVTSPINTDNSAQINNFLELSKNAYESGNGESAFEYANKALELNLKNPKAWICKMKSIEYNSTFGNIRMMEVVEAGKNAINYASDEEKEAITYQVYQYQLLRALDLLKLVTGKFHDIAEIKSTYQQFCLISFITASKNALTVDKGVVDVYDKVADEAVAVVKLVPDSVLFNNKELARLTGECAKQYQYVTDALVARYKVYGAALVDSAHNIRNSNKQAMQEKADRAMNDILHRENEAMRIASEERTREYWANNAEKKVELESERQELEQKISEFKSQIDAIKGENECRALQLKVFELNKEKGLLGMFKGKEKKAIQEKIDETEREIQNIKSRMEAERTDIEKKIEPLSFKLNYVISELTKPR